MRKAHRLKWFWQVAQATFCTVQRAYILGQVAEWILSTTLDTMWCVTGVLLNCLVMTETCLAVFH